MANIPGGNNPSGTKTWPPSRVARLRVLWEKGYSARQIALMLGDGITRNSVISAARRAGCASRPSPLVHLTEDQKAERQARREKLAALSDKGQRSIASRQAQALTFEKKRAANALTGCTGGDPVRANLKAQATFAERRSPEKATRRVTPMEVREPKQAAVDDGKRGVPLADIRSDGCRFAVTPHHVAAANHRFCNAPRVDHRYCAEHCERARSIASVSSADQLDAMSEIDANVPDGGVKKAEAA